MLERISTENTRKWRGDETKTPLARRAQGRRIRESWTRIQTLVIVGLTTKQEVVY